MESNTSTPSSLDASPGEAPAGHGGLPVGLDRLAVAIAELAAGDPDQLGDALLAAQVLATRRLIDQLEGVWLHQLATLDGRGAAGAEAGTSAPSTAGWLRAALRMSAGLAAQRVRTARALHRGPLAATAAALAAGQVSYPHAAALADATSDLPPAKVTQAEPVLVDAARRLDPGRLRRLAAHLRDLVDPDAAEQRARARLDRRGLWLAATVDGMVAVDGLLDPEAGEAVQAALMPLARPTGPDDDRTAAQRRADALGELARQGLQAGRLPQAGGLRPQLTVTIELASLLTPGGGVGAVGGWGGTLPAETTRRLACDATITRAIIHRHPNPADPGHPSLGNHPTSGGGATDGDGVAAQLRDAIALLPPPLGAPTELLDLGRATRVITPGLRRALAARDGGCAAQGCDRPPPWTDAHHLHHWLHGGPTSLDNLILLCRVHHLAVHEHHWQLHRDPVSGQVTLAPPARRGHSPPAA
jgi:Domain of unknown function (DUF222)/HNH endonuclease